MRTWKYPRRLILAAVLALAAWLRLRRLDDATLTNDEMLSWIHAHEPLSHILSHNLAPLHHFLAWIALSLGSAEGVLRLPSALAGIAGCWATYAFGKRAHSVPAGLAAALILAVSPFHALHSREARFYALMTLGALAAVWMLWQSLEDDRFRRWARFALVSLPALVVHQFMLPFQAVLVATAGGILLVRKARPGQTRWSPLVRLLVATLAGGAVVLTLALYAGAPTGLFQGTIEQAFPGAEAEEEPSRTLYRLTPAEFLSYGGQWSFLTTSRGAETPGLAMGVTIGVVAFGLGVLLVRRRSLGVLCAGVMLLMPAPFFFLDVWHWHEAKYFTPIFALAVFCAGVGIAEAGRLVSAVLAPRMPDRWAPWLPGSMAAVFLALAGAFVASPLREAQGFAQDRPQFRWREAVAFMEETFSPDDLVIYAADFGADAASIDRGLRFYFKRDVTNGLAYLYAARPYIGMLDGDAFTQLVATKPDQALWLVSIHESALDPGLIEAVERLEPTRHRFGSLTLWAVGAPATNLVVDGAFRGEDLPEGRNVAITRGEESRGIRLEPEADSPRVAAIPLVPQPYRLRNPDFALWTAEGPLGWRLDAPAGTQLTQVGGVTPDMPAMAVRPDPDGETVVRQSIALGAAAGRTVGIRALASSDIPNQLGLRLTVGRHVYEAWHEGTREWEPLVLSAAIPAAAPVGDAEVAVVVRPGGDAAITRLEIGVDLGAPTLDPLQEYTLSFDMRTANLPLYQDMPQLGFLYTGPEGGETQWAPVYEFGHTVPWQRYAFRVRPGETLPADATGVMLGVQFRSTSGKVWLDRVQLESGPSPTLFVNGLRLPHDERWMRAVLQERAAP